MLTPLLSNRERLLWLTGAALTLIWLLIYLTTVSPTVNFIDSGELITAVREPGIAHPPGYPLYVLLGFVASHILWGDEAWRVNVFSAFWGAMSVGAFFILIYRFTTYPRPEPVPTTPRSQHAQGSNLMSKDQLSPYPNQRPNLAQPTHH